MAIDVAAAGQLTESESESEADLEPDDEADPDAPEPVVREPVSTARRAVLFGLVVVTALAALVSWLGLRTHESQLAAAQRSQFLQVARQGALNLTTIDWRRAEADVRRILDSATGEFFNDFDRRSKPFIEVLQQAKASTVGTITEAGLESQTADTAQALVQVSVQTSNAGAVEPVPRVWRMRISVARVGDQVKVANVGFVQ